MIVIVVVVTASYTIWSHIYLSRTASQVSAAQGENHPVGALNWACAAIAAICEVLRFRRRVESEL